LNIYNKKQQWKIFLFIVAVIIVAASLVYSNLLVKKIASEERAKIKIWAEAIQNKANLVKYTEEFFEKIKEEERKKVEIWAEATQLLVGASTNDDVTFYSKIIQGNNNIPVVLTDEKRNIQLVRNVEFTRDSVKILDGNLLTEFSVYKPIELIIGKKKNYLFYKESKLFTELRTVLNDLIKSFISEVVINSASVPVIITDSSRTKIIVTGNIDTLKLKDSNFLFNTLANMESQNQALEISISNKGKNYIFYENSALLKRLFYYPYVQFGIIGIFILIAYILFSTSRNSEQNKVWAGMAKETAHQLGTPLSSLIAWVELLKIKGMDDDSTREITKDITRLEIISQRFSKIGSETRLENEDLIRVITGTLDYIKKRISNKINIVINFNPDQPVIIPLNKYLFDWVIENLLKNAADSMAGSGTITIDIDNNSSKYVIIDITDTGKGIPKSKFRTIFNPGYTSKQRGWGLGLSLSERIIKKYHAGKIFVKQSVMNKGSTFRIILRKSH